MALEIVEKESHGVTVLALAGRVTLGQETNQLRSKIREALDKGKTRLVLALGDVSYIASSRQGTLVSSFATAAGQRGTIKRANLTKRFHEELNLTNLVALFDVPNAHAQP